MRFVRALFIAVTPLLVIAGCGKKEAPPAPAPVQTASAPAAAPADDAAERARAAEAAAARRREAEWLRTVLETRVFFEYDDSEIRGAARTALDEKARVLRDNPDIRLRIEGHADERGSTEYNLALGSRRASSVVSYLAGFGIAGVRLETVSFGEERPLTGGRDETAWSQNRRAEFAITAGAP